MNIAYRNSKVKKQCTDFARAKKDFPEKIAKELHKLVNLIEAAENLQSVTSFPKYHFHNLKRDRQGQYAFDIAGRKSSYRLIVTFDDFDNNKIFSETITIEDIKIEEVSKHYE